MTINYQKQLNCLIKPMGTFGDHTKGYSGCLWCDQILDCVKFHPTEGNSLWFRDPKSIKMEYRLKKIIGETMALNNDQMKFIEQKVKALGDQEEVKIFYRKDCVVDKYANAYAKKLFGNPVKKLRRI